MEVEVREPFTTISLFGDIQVFGLPDQQSVTLEAWGSPPSECAYLLSSMSLKAPCITLALLNVRKLD